MKKLLLIFLVMLCQRFLYAQSKNAVLDSLLNYMHNKYSFDGVALVADGNGVVYKKAFGLANRDWSIGNTTTTKFRLGSVSKQFIGYVIIKLSEEGKLKLDDLLSKYLPAFNLEDKKNISIRNLLTHTSGIFDYTDVPAFNSRYLYPQDSLVKMIAMHPLNFQPSERYSYSNSNFYLLTVVAEKVLGKRFETILTEEILIPAGMRNSGIEHNENILSNRALPYINTKSGFINGEYIELSNVAAAMYSTADDLLSWSRFMQKQLRTDKFLKSALQRFDLAGGTTSIYACGWCLLPDKIMHQGHINGFANHISIDTIHHYTVIILSNNDFKGLYVTGKMISLILRGSSDVLPGLTKKISSGLLSEYVGTFVRGQDTVTNKNENGELVAYLKNRRFPWKPFCKDEFFSELFEGNILFERNNNGEVNGLLSFEDYDWIEWKKIR